MRAVVFMVGAWMWTACSDPIPTITAATNPTHETLPDEAEPPPSEVVEELPPGREDPLAALVGVPVGEVAGGPGPNGVGQGGPAASPARTRARLLVRETATEVVAGDLDGAVLRRLVRTRIRSIARCLEMAMRAGGAASVTGRVQIGVSVDTQGRTTSAAMLQNGLTAPDAGPCFVQTFRRFRFPPPTQASRATVSLTVSPAPNAAPPPRTGGRSGGSLEDLLGSPGMVPPGLVDGAGRPPPEVVRRTRTREAGVEVAGDFSVDMVRRMARRRLRAFSACVDRQIAVRGAPIEGMQQIRFTLNTLGQVVNVAMVTSTVGEPSVDACVLAQLRRWRFNPGPDADVTVLLRLVHTMS